MTAVAFALSLSLIQHGDFDGGGVTAVAFSLSNSLLVSGGRDGRVLVWKFDLDQKALSLLATLQCGSKAVSGIGVCPDADGGYSCIWTSSLDNKLRRWDKVSAAHSPCLGIRQVPCLSWPRALALTLLA